MRTRNREVSGNLRRVITRLFGKLTVTAFQPMARSRHPTAQPEPLSSMPTAMRRTAAVAAFLLACLPAKASATWSIVVLDRATGRIGVAAASCTSDVYGILGMVPGTGVVMAQAIEHQPAMREALRLLRAGVAPDSVLRVITSVAIDSASQDRQYDVPPCSIARWRRSSERAPPVGRSRRW